MIPVLCRGCGGSGLAEIAFDDDNRTVQLTPVDGWIVGEDGYFYCSENCLPEDVEDDSGS